MVCTSPHRFLIVGFLKADNSAKASNKSAFFTQPLIRNLCMVNKYYGLILIVSEILNHINFIKAARGFSTSVEAWVDGYLLFYEVLYYHM